MRNRLGADIGGTFTDIALESGGQLFSAKCLTTHAAPEQAILDGIDQVTQAAGIGWGDLDQIIHGTTLATNALIERRGARVAFVTTQGFRDVIEMRTESRFDQYDLNLTLPAPLVPREDRFTVAGRIGAQGQELAPLDEAGLQALAGRIAAGGFGAVAIGFLHAYANPAHEERARAVIAAQVGLPVSISSAVSPQMREYERFNTTCANAYVQPLMASYLTRLRQRLTAGGAACPVLMIHSGGGLMALETAAEFPVRLIESGPAGGAIFAADVARRFGLESVVSYDMGGTTAKICLIEGFTPKTARSFEVARTTRFAKGSGMPVSIPVIEMIEIGAGGGSLASVDAMGRIRTGPQSAGSEPGPACYQRGGRHPTITDADLVLGKIDARNFAGGALVLSRDLAESAILGDVAAPLGLPVQAAAFGIAEVVDEAMANAARVHAVESGRSIADSVMVAFGGAAPLHAARLCEKLGIARCLIPVGAGVGSAIGFLKAPFGFEALASRLMPLAEFDAEALNRLIAGLRASAEGFVRAGTKDPIRAEITAFMRYRGQGWEIPVPLEDRPFVATDAESLRDSFGRAYARFFGRAIDALSGLEPEIVTLSVKVEDIRPQPERQPMLTGGTPLPKQASRPVLDPGLGKVLDTALFDRDALKPGQRVAGPAIIVERETATVLTSGFDAVMQGDGALLMLRKETRNA